MKARKIASLTSLISFIVLIVTSVVLYIVPHGRVAYWADWRLWGLTKTEWSAIHTNIGVLFMIAIIVHIFYNWKSILMYLKTKTKKNKLVTWNFNIALLLTILFTIGTYFEIPPFSTMIAISESIKDNATQKYGEPPYAHAELSSLKSFAEKMKLDLQQSITKLKNEGIKIENEEQKILEIAKANRLSPQRIYTIMKMGNEGNSTEALPDNPPPGFGKQTIATICEKYNLNRKEILKILADKNIVADENSKFKDIAKEHNLYATEIYQILKEVLMK